jgi:uncharacterized protein (DUF1810 family)
MSSLDRFTAAQASPDAGFDAALSEIRAGRKRGHWIWYVLPQLRGLGVSAASVEYGLDGVDEAAAYLRDPTLRDRLVTIAAAVAEQLHAGVTLDQLMGSAIDARKLVSSLTLFGRVAAQLRDEEGAMAHRQLAALARDVLAKAAAEGYPACDYTLARLTPREPGV